MKLQKYLLLLLLFAFFSLSIFAQNQYDNLPIEAKIRVKEGKSTFFSNAKSGSGSNATIQTTGPEQQCNSAIPVCQNIYTTSTSYSGNGSTQEIPGNSCLASNELNSVWYTFTSSTSGNIAFNITPNVLGQDYDFALYNLTGTNCSAISSGALTPIRCNYSATGGVTGLSSSGTNASEPANGSNQSTVLATTIGQTYVLIISNYSSSANGYQLNFTPGTASIFDVTPPTLTSVNAICGSNVLTLNTSEQITCASIAANGSDISISGTGGPYTITGATGVNCGSATAQITFTITPALTGAGPWVLNAHPGSDGNSFIDNCGNAMPTTTISFIIPPPAAAITGPANVCKGSTFALSSSSAISYTWSGAAVPAGQQNQQTISITANAAGTLNFNLVVNYGACGSYTLTKTVTVTDAPIANFTALPSLTICAGTPVTFTNTSTYPCSSFGLGLNQCNCGSFGCNTTSNQGTFATYLWTFGDGGVDFYILGSPASAFSPIHTYASAGTYNISLTASGLINTCSNNKNLTITVLPATPNLTVSPTTTICPGQSSTLTAIGGTTYTWSPSATLNTVNGGTVVATPATTTTYSVSTPGCGANQTATVQVVVGGTPPVIGAINGSTLICANSTGITYSVTNVAGTNYTWSVPIGASITSAPTNSNAITVTFGASAGTVSVTAVGTCGTSTVSLVVSLSPALNLTVTPSAASICAGSSTTLTVSGATNYTWSPSASLSSPNGATVTASPITATTYTVIGATGACTGAATATITMATGLTLTVTANTPTVCPGSSALLNASGASSYTWSPAATLNSANGSGVTATPLANTIYTVMGSTGTCTGVATVSVGIGSCAPTSCNLALIRSTLTAAGNVELLGMNNTCSLYFINPQFMTGPAAQTYAQSFGANLISVQSASENADLLNALSNQGYSSNVIWIGFSDAVLEGSFIWYDGAPITYSNWAPGEPNNSGGNENCTQIYPNGTWNDLNCSGYNSLSVIEVNICPQVTVVNPPIHCPNTNVTLNASTLFGSPSYTYTWIQSGTETFTNTSSAGNTNVITITSAVANTFTVFSNDRYSCPQSASITLSVNPTPTITVNSATICAGQTTTLTANGASTYSWIPGTGLSATSGAIVTGTPSTTQNYTVVGMDLNGCFGGTITTILVNPVPTITVNSATICVGQQTATLIANGASSYTWSPAVNLSSSFGTAVTGTPTTTENYTITATDANGCFSSATSTITVNSLPIITANSATICVGQQTATLTAAGATTYSWIPGTGLSATNVAVVTGTPGATQNYTVAGMDANGCISGTTTAIMVNNLPNITANSATICVGQQTATLTAAGATTYTWIPGTGLSATNVAVVTGTPGASQNYTVTGMDANGCINGTTATITVNPLPTVTVNSSTICIGQQTATLIANGASSYTWSPAVNLSSSFGTTVTGTPTTTESYTITATDANGCFSSTTSTITVNSLPIITANSATICVGQQTATLTAAGATTYSWIPGTGLSATNVAVVTGTPGATQNYTVAGMDLNGCINGTTTTITVNNLPNITANSGTICVGQQTATLTATGAATYTWIPGTGLSATNVAVVTGTPGASQNYTVAGMDANGCINGTTSTITVNPLPTVTVNSSTICIGQQTATLIANGASSYTWSPAVNLSSSFGTTVTGTPTTTENYTITATDNNGCFSSATSTITVNALPTITATSSTICVGQQTATLTAAGATTYSWIPGTGLSATNVAVVTGTPGATQNYTVAGMNANGCISGTTTAITVNTLPTITVNSATICVGQQTATLTATGAVTYSWIPGTGLSATNVAVVTGTPGASQNYTVAGMDANGCINGTTSTITVNTLPIIAVSPNMTVCPLSANTLTVSGAATYTWLPNTFLNNNNTSNVICTPSVTTTYTVNGISAVACKNSNTITVVVANTVVVNASASTPTICPLGSTPITASGATTYTWSPSLTLSSANGSTVTASPPTSTTYTVIGSTSTCTNSAQVVVTLTVNPVISIATSPSVICSGSSSALTASGANTYIWSPAATLNSAFGTLVNANPNITTTYNVLGTTALGCASSSTVTVTVVATPTITAMSNPLTICAGNTSTLSAFGAASYNWFPSGSVSNATGNPTIASPALTTIYTITGSNGTSPFLCSSSNTVQIIVNPNPTVTPSPSVPICEGQQTTIYATGGTTYTWSPTTGVSNPNSSTTIVKPTATTIYTVTATTNSCSSTATVEVLVNLLPLVNAGIDSTINIDNTITLLGTGTGYEQMGFLSSDGSPLSCNYCYSITVNPQNNTCYTLEGISRFGCRSVDEVCITVTKDWDVFIPNAFTPNDDLNNEVFIPMGYGISEIKLTIFDRWGKQIFKSTDGNIGWDGKNKGLLCEQGVYIYQAEITSMAGPKVKRTGHVTLLPRIK